MRTLLFEREELILAEYKVDNLTGEGNITGMWAVRNVDILSYIGAEIVAVGQIVDEDDLTMANGHTLTFKVNGATIETYTAAGGDGTREGLDGLTAVINGGSSGYFAAIANPGSGGGTFNTFDLDAPAASGGSLNGAVVLLEYGGGSSIPDKTFTLAGGRAAHTPSADIVEEDLALRESTIENFITFCTNGTIKLTSHDQDNAVVLYDPAA